ncbi:MAG: two-component regulator propeller domain-containing protein [bacterium]
MKNIYKIVIVTIISLMISSFNLLAEEWIQYTYGESITALAEEGDFVWVGTSAGLVKLNKETKDEIFFNTANSGLPRNKITSIAIDNYGNKWIGTEIGLVKFDDINWIHLNDTNSGLPNNNIKKIIIDKNSDLWIGTLGGGLAKFDGINWDVFNIENTGMPINSVEFLTLDKSGVIWICPPIVRESPNNYEYIGFGLVKFDGINWTKYDTASSDLPDDKVLTVDFDENNNKWIGTYDSGLVFFNDTNWIIYNHTNSGIPKTQISSIKIDKNDFIWIGTGFGLIKYKEYNCTIYLTVYNSSNSDLPKYDVNVLTIDSEENKWLSTYSGLYKFDSLNAIKYNTSNSGLSYWKRINDIAIDKNGVKWIGTINGGLLKFDNNGWLLFNRDNSPLKRNDIEYITIDSNGIKWIGNLTEGIIKYDDINWTYYDTSNSLLPDNHTGKVKIDKFGVKWLFTGSKIIKIYNDDWTIYSGQNCYMLDNGINSLELDSKGNIWIATSKQFIKFDGSNWLEYKFPSEWYTYDNNYRPWISIMMIDKSDNVWVRSLGYGKACLGIAKFDGNNWKLINTGNSDIPDNSVKVMAEDKNNIMWIGFEEVGLGRYDGTNWIIYNELNSGLPNNSINSIVIDGQGNKWIGTDGGIAVLLAEETPVEENNPKSQEQILLDIIPNPFSDETEISFNLAEPGVTKITISDLLGNEIFVLKNEYNDSGVHSVKFNSFDYKLPSGIYFCTIHVNGISETKKLLKLMDK